MRDWTFQDCIGYVSIDDIPQDAYYDTEEDEDENDENEEDEEDEDDDELITLNG